MTFLSSQTPTPRLSPPQKLTWVTIPLIVQIVFSVIGIVALPFLIPFFNLLLSSPDLAQDSTTSPAELRAILAIFSASIWIVEIVSLAFLALYFFTYRAVQQGKAWGRIVAIVIFILGLFSFPLGTALGIFGLIGAFDAEVTAYCDR